MKYIIILFFCLMCVGCPKKTIIEANIDLHIGNIACSSNGGLSHVIQYRYNNESYLAFTCGNGFKFGTELPPTDKEDMSK